MFFPGLIPGGQCRINVGGRQRWSQCHFQPPWRTFTSEIRPALIAGLKGNHGLNKASYSWEVVRWGGWLTRHYVICCWIRTTLVRYAGDMTAADGVLIISGKQPILHSQSPKHKWGKLESMISSFLSIEKRCETENWWDFECHSFAMTLGQRGMWCERSSHSTCQKPQKGSSSFFFVWNLCLVLSVKMFVNP